MIRFQGIYLYIGLALIFLASCRFTGAYFYLLGSLISIISYLCREESRVGNLELSFLRWPLLFLLPYVILVFFGDLIYIGLSIDLRASFLMMLNIPLGFIAGALISNRGTSFSSDPCPSSPLLFVASGALGAIISSLFASFLNWHVESFSTSSLRASEGLLVIGLALLIFFVSFFKFEHTFWAKFSLSAALSGIVFACGLVPFIWLNFRGLNSLLIALLTSLLLFIRSLGVIKILRLSQIRFWTLTSVATLLALFTVSFENYRELFFRYIVFPFYAFNKLNGRMLLYEGVMPYLSSAPLLGRAQNLHNFQSQWAHSFILDTILYHGYLAAFFLVAFLGQFLVCLIASRVAVMQRFVYSLIIFCLFVGSLLQPVEFSDGIAFQLSFIFLGLVYGALCVKKDYSLVPLLPPVHPCDI